MTSHRRFKDAIYEQLARIAKGFSAPKRMELLDLLCQGPRTVEALAELAGLSVANASQHLRVLRAARLVESEKKGLYVEYRLADEQVSSVFVAVRMLAESRLAEIEQVTREYFGARDGMEAIASDELLRRAQRGEVTVLDVRPLEEFRAGHLRGALSIPLSELRARLDEVPRGRIVAAYCRGPYCVMSLEAVKVLRAKGYLAHCIEQGVADFRARGWTVMSEQEGPRP
ncbi:MAG: metalloregulator ArsR/SmtB family transcription factor [Myxococcales bacterium]|nr:metalloregulator ArsR/SmtB family transcription factor [Myxococcales bacterium]